MNPDDRYFIEALSRGLRILETFTVETPSLSLVEIASIVQLDKSTVFRFVYTLEKLGYLERDHDTKKYRPGLKVTRLGFQVITSLDVTQIARPFLSELSEKTGEATNMSIRDEAEIVYVLRLSPIKVVNINLQVGSRLPVHCTSMGKIQLIDLSYEELQSLLGAEPFKPYTPHTLTSLDELYTELTSIKLKGYAINDEELAIGLRSIAAPIRDSSGRIVAAINISVLNAQISSQEFEERLSSLIVKTAHEISTTLGATG